MHYPVGYFLLPLSAAGLTETFECPTTSIAPINLVSLHLGLMPPKSSARLLNPFHTNKNAPKTAVLAGSDMFTVALAVFF